MPYQIKGSVGIICMREKMKIEESAVHFCVGVYPKRMIVSSYLEKEPSVAFPFWVVVEK